MSSAIAGVLLDWAGSCSVQSSEPAAFAKAWILPST
jgi:hypothetical protein